MIESYTTFLRRLIVGSSTHIPVLRKLFARGTGGTDSARYCYSVWLRHLMMAHKNGLLTVWPGSVAELGPGDSIGIGLAALISGVNNYSAFDAVRYADSDNNLNILDELVRLFKEHEDIPDEDEFPNLKPGVDSYLFPYDILNSEFNELLNEDRIGSIKKALKSSGDMNNSEVYISYFAPWYDSKVINEGSIDMIYSQAVLEHIDDLEFTYNTLYRWLKPGGFMSHQIDFSSHGLSDKWNGHWAYSDLSWKLIRGGRQYLLNREPLSTHLDLMKGSGFEIVCNIKTKDTTEVRRKDLSSRFINMTDDDFLTSCAFVQAIKK